MCVWLADLFTVELRYAEALQLLIYLFLIWTSHEQVFGSLQYIRSNIIIYTFPLVNSQYLDEIVQSLKLHPSPETLLNQSS